MVRRTQKDCSNAAALVFHERNIVPTHRIVSWRHGSFFGTDCRNHRKVRSSRLFTSKLCDKVPCRYSCKSSHALDRVSAFGWTRKLWCSGAHCFKGWRNRGRSWAYSGRRSWSAVAAKFMQTGGATGRDAVKKSRHNDYGLGFGSLSTILGASGEHASTNWMPK